MTDKYWVGGTGNTNDTAHWSLTSGGATGAAVPGTTDNAIFDAASDSGAGFTVTVNAAFTCLNFDNTAVDQIMTLAGTSAWSVYGSFTVKSTTVRTYTGGITFAATSTGKTITINGVSFASSNCTFNGVGGGWTLGSALTTFNIGLTAGALDTGGYNVTTSNPFTVSGTGVRSLTLGASIVTTDTWACATTTNLTFSAGTSTIKNTSNNAFNGGGLTYYDVELPSGNSSTSGIAGANTFHNLTFKGSDSASAVEPTWVRIYSNQTITGTFTPSQTTNVNARVTVQSDVPSTQRTLTCAAVSIANTDFQSIVIAGAAAPASGTSVGDAGNNSGITFTAAKTVYAVGTTSWSWTANKWATSSGGAVSYANFPLPQDTVIIDNSSVNTSATITGSSYYFYPTVNCSTRSNAMSLYLLGGSSITGVTGPLTVNSAITITNLLFSLAANQNFDQNGATISGAVTINNPGTTLTLTANLTTSSGITYNYGNLSLGSYTMTGTTFASNTNATRTLNFGTGKISLTGNNATICTIGVTSLTVSGTPVIEATYSGATGTRTITTGSPTEANSISFNITAGTDIVSSGAVNRNLVLTGFAGTLSNIARTLYGNWTNPASGITYTAGTNATTFAATSGTKTITTNGVTLDFPLTFNGVGGTFALGGALTLGSTRLLTQTNGTLNLAGYTLTTGTYATAAGTKNLTWNGSTLVISGSGTTAFNNANPTNFTNTAGTGNGIISFTSASASTMVGGGSTFNATLSQDGAGTLTITGSNTFADIRNTTQPVNIKLAAGTTTTFTSGFSLGGSTSGRVTLGSTTASVATISKASGTVTGNYLIIGNVTATGGATWAAGTYSLDAGGNSGWTFPSRTTVILTSGTSWTVPSDWNSSENLIEVIGGGGSGSIGQNIVAYPSGGGGAAYAAKFNLSLTPGDSITYSVGTGGAAVTASAKTVGNNGGDTWFNGASLAASSVGAKGGQGGQFGSGTNALGGAGGASASGIGNINFSGGSGAPVSASGFHGSGGGAAGPSGAGASGGNGTSGTGGGGGGGGSNDGVVGSVNSGNTGGAGGVGFVNSGAGGSGGSNTSFGLVGSAGTLWSGTHGPGGGAGGAGAAAQPPVGTAGNGGLYGGGGGSVSTNSPTSVTGSAGAQGLIVISYVPGGVSVSPTGVSASGSLGSLSVVATANVSPTGVSASGAIGDVVVSLPVSVSPTGVSASGAVGDVTVSAGGNISVSPTGVSASGSLGSLSVVAAANVSPTGVSASGAIGDVTISLLTQALVTGVSATGSVGTTDVIGLANVSPTGVSATGSVGTVVAGTITAVSVTGVSASGAVGDVAVSGKATVSPTGVSASGSIGTVVVSAAISVTVSPTGVSASGAVGTVVVSAAISVTVSPTGVSASGAVGDAAVSGKANVSPTGVSASGSVGTTVVSLPVSFSVTGVSASGSIGTTTVAAQASASPTGVSATGSVGTAAVSGKANVSPTGVSASGAIGTVVVSLPVSFSVTGVSASGSVGTVAVVAQASASPTGVFATGSVGTVDVSGKATVSPTGVSASGAIGTVTTQSSYYVTGVSAQTAVGSVAVIGSSTVTPTGVYGVGELGRPFIWGVINDAQTPNWIRIPT